MVDNYSNRHRYIDRKHKLKYVMQYGRLNELIAIVNPMVSKWWKLAMMQFEKKEEK